MAYYGGKTRLAAKIADLLPRHEHYIEPFAGSLAVLLEKKPSRMETVNDLDGLLMTFWRVLRDRPDELARACALTPHSRAEYADARAADLECLDDVETARLVWIQITQGRGGTLRKTGWRHYVDPSGTSKGMPGYLAAYVDRMAATAERLHHVTLESRPALDIIKQYGAFANCCLYVDPPYLGDTRSHGGGGYQLEMRGRDEHLELLWELMGCQAAVVVSGYPSALYEDALAGWDRIAIETMTGQAKSSNKARTEVLWSNREISDQRSLFDLEAGA
ncbi:DNA adenine methylase [Mycolicibacterium goodii]|uniref:DNA adenine methylase n=1 Tax=Mycolicibacterium goodii TaxID=134601 RepID=UPI001BDC7B6F|nr:DNA adenine methylase [Mycolicibacterium goodii]MBU8813916.1 DNA adenine methylase [Mycolicibacterium goodii]